MSSFKHNPSRPPPATSGGTIKKSQESVAALLRRIQEINTDSNIDELIQLCRNTLEGEEHYVKESCTPETQLQKRIVQDTLEDSSVSPWARMLSGKLGGCFIKSIAEIARAKRILEIGMFTGYSAVTFAETSNCEEMVCLEIEPDMEKFVQERLRGTPVEKKIRIEIGPAQESLKKLKENNEKFDLVYIDANKDGYLEYYKFIMDNGILNESTGVILCDNILWRKTTMNQSTQTGKILHEFVQYVLQDDRVMQMIIPISDGIFMVKLKNAM